MPKSKPVRVFNLTQVTKKTREQKDKLFEKIQACMGEYQHCFVFNVDGMRNSYLKDVRKELDDCRIFFGKTKLMARALGTTPEHAAADGTHKLARYLTGNVGLLFTNRDPSAIISYFIAFSPVDFARAGAVAPRRFSVSPGLVFSTGGEVPAADDVPIAVSLEPELRKLGMPTRLLRGKVVLGDEKGESETYIVCKEGDVLDARQTRLLKLFSVCLSEFRVRVLAYWSAGTGEVTEVDPENEGGKEGKNIKED